MSSPSSSTSDHPGRHTDKLRPDAARAGVVERTALIEHLSSAPDARVVAVVAPAGYGKSTLLAQWIDHDPRASAWLTIDQYDSDPAVLLTDVGLALQQAGLLAADALADVRFTSKNALSHGVWELTSRIEGARPGILFLDQVDGLGSQASRDTVAELAFRLPASMTLVVASRSDIGLPAAAFRSRGELLELSANDLAMGNDEAATLAAHTGLDANESLVDALVERTEGWPVGLYLMMLAVRSGDPSPPLSQVRGDDQFLADYMRVELIDRISPDRASFMMRISILDDFSGPLCDFVLERTGTYRVLESLASANMLVVPLDHRRRWYRYHQLFREFLQAELYRREPELVASLRLKASAWYENHGMVDKAVRHAMAAGDEDRAAGLVAAAARLMFAEGRADTVLGWLAWFQEGGRSERYPGIAVIAALAYAHIGDAAAAQRSFAVVDSAGDSLGPLRPVAGITRAQLCPAGIAQMLRDATEAQAALTPASEWYAATLAIEGLALLWSGEVDDADVRLADAAETGERFNAMPAATFSLAARSTIAAERGDHASADALADRSLLLVRRAGLERYATSVLPLVVAARAARHRGNPQEARRMLSRASALRPLLTAALPAVSAHTLLEMAEAEVELGDIAGARQVLRKVGDILRPRSGFGRLEDRYARMREELASMPAGTTAVSTLTNAELRLLPFLVTHLSFPQIGERLYISRHTVKTQAISIYRKLGVSSRSEAVRVAREMHLLDV